MARSEVYGPLDDSEDGSGGRSRARTNPVEELRAIRDKAVHTRARAEQHDPEMQLSQIEQRILGIRDKERRSRPPRRPGRARAIDSDGGRPARRPRKAVPYDDVVLDEDARALEEPAGEPLIVPARRARSRLCCACTVVAALAGMMLAFDVVTGHDPIEQVLQSMNVTTGLYQEMTGLWGESPPPPSPSSPPLPPFRAMIIEQRCERPKRIQARLTLRRTLGRTSEHCI